jgi:hypothetical protein
MSDARAKLRVMTTTTARDFATHLAVLLRRERLAMADFLVALAEFDRARHWLALGYANLFDFLHRELGLSKGTAFYRKVAAELIQRYPEIVEPLRDGRLCVTAIHALSRAITPANRSEVLPRFFHVSKQEAKAVAAEIAPEAVVPRKDVVTVVSVASSTTGPRAIETPAQNSQPVGSSGPASPKLELMPAPAQRIKADPLTSTETRLHLTVSPAFLEKLETAKLALSHAKAGATAEEVLAAGLDLLLANDARRKGLVAKPRKTAASSRPDPSSRYVPAAVRREVWTRDAGRCQWPLDSGGICGSTLRPELDHVRPWARGGATTPDNLRVLCDFHNQLAAREAYGRPSSHSADPASPRPVLPFHTIRVSRTTSPGSNGSRTRRPTRASP